MLSNIERVIIVIAAVAVIAVGSLYISQRVHTGCLWGNCAVIVTK